MGREAHSAQEKIGQCDPGRSLGTLKVVGLGPGSPEHLSPKAREALVDADVVVGYKGYLQLIEPEVLKGKEVISTGMTKEIERCRKAIEKALEGKNTAVVSSGDSGIYGMAGLVLELLIEEGRLDDVEVEMVPGVPALAAAAALLGAPLMHDFAVISLSDLLTPWEIIEQRVKAALEADFVLVFYNPRSRKRNWQLGKVMEMVSEYRGNKAPVGIVRNAMRDGQEVIVGSASELDLSCVDMLSIVLVGNSQTRLTGGRMITPRGYMSKYGTTEVYRKGGV
jgi:precorrin-3B C17-methyltransferase